MENINENINENGNENLVKFSRDNEYTQMKKLYNALVEAGHVKKVDQINSRELIVTINNVLKSNSIDHKILNYLFIQQGTEYDATTVVGIFEGLRLYLGVSPR